MRVYTVQKSTLMYDSEFGYRNDAYGYVMLFWNWSFVEEHLKYKEGILNSVGTI